MFKAFPSVTSYIQGAKGPSPLQDSKGKVYTQVSDCVVKVKWRP